MHVAATSSLLCHDEVAIHYDGVDVDKIPSVNDDVDSIEHVSPIGSWRGSCGCDRGHPLHSIWRGHNGGRCSIVHSPTYVETPLALVEALQFVRHFGSMLLSPSLNVVEGQHVLPIFNP